MPVAFSRYGRPTIVVTESGCDVPNESQLDAAVAVRDSFRIDYYREYLAAAMKAKHEDGVRLEVCGCTNGTHGGDAYRLTMDQP